LKNFIKQFIPPILLSIIKGKQVAQEPQSMWSGNYMNWEEAMQKCTGYDSAVILEKCKNALLKVKNGEAVYERDSVLFDEIQYSWPLLAIIQHVALEYDATLSLIDFGGSLGSSFFQNKLFLNNLKRVEWVVVEQDHFVKCGKKYFENEQLRFEYDIDSILSKYNSKLLLLSGVLQYLNNPYEKIEKFISYGFEYIAIDLVVCAESHIITVQNVPPIIYSASYPCHFFYESELLKAFENDYNVIAKFDAYPELKIPLVNNKKGVYRGFFLKKK